MRLNGRILYELFEKQFLFLAGYEDEKIGGPEQLFEKTKITGGTTTESRDSKAQPGYIT